MHLSEQIRPGVADARLRGHDVTGTIVGALGPPPPSPPRKGEEMGARLRGGVSQ
jgi:hypothetical protein